ncbi:MAG TPA: beta-galactosidase [Coleofasciculaceae cyanobacterium]
MYREECHRIVTLLAERYGKHPAIAAGRLTAGYSS